MGLSLGGAISRWVSACKGVAGGGSPTYSSHRYTLFLPSFQGFVPPTAVCTILILLPRESAHRKNIPLVPPEGSVLRRYAPRDPHCSAGEDPRDALFRAGGSLC